MTLEWTQLAIADLVEARAYVELDSPHAAQDLARRILAAAESLLDMPLIGRKGRSRATREKPVAGTPFILVYRLKAERVQILRVYHGHRRWPPRPLARGSTA